MIYLRYNDQIKKIIKEEELNISNMDKQSQISNNSFINKNELKSALYNSNNNINNIEKEKQIINTENEKNLEKISERSQEGKGVSSEEYNIYSNKNYSSNDSIYEDKSITNKKNDSNNLLNDSNILKRAKNIRIDTNIINTESDLILNKNEENKDNLFLGSDKNTDFFKINNNDNCVKCQFGTFEKLNHGSIIHSNDNNLYVKNDYNQKNNSFEKSLNINNVDSSTLHRFNNEKEEIINTFYKRNTNKVDNDDICFKLDNNLKEKNRKDKYFKLNNDNYNNIQEKEARVIEDEINHKGKLI